MLHSATSRKHSPLNTRKPIKHLRQNPSGRYTVALTPSVARQVRRYAETADTSMSKAMAALVRLGLEHQEGRKRDFFKKLRENLDNQDPQQQDQLVDEFRALILGR